MKNRSAAAPAPQTIQIYFTQKHDGCVYALDPLSRQRIEKEFPHARISSRIFVGFDKEGAFEEVQGPIWNQVARMLTGLTEPQIEALGGIELVDPDTESRRRVTALAS